MTDTTIDPTAKFKPLARTGLTQAEMATIFGVSRVTMNNWLCGRGNPHPLLRDRVTKRLKAIKAALAAGHLPITDDLTPKNKMLRVAAVLKQHLAA